MHSCLRIMYVPSSLEPGLLPDIGSVGYDFYPTLTRHRLFFEDPLCVSSERQRLWHATTRFLRYSCPSPGVLRKPFLRLTKPVSYIDQ